MKLHLNLRTHISLFIISIGSCLVLNAKTTEPTPEINRTKFIRIGIDPTRNLQTYLQGADRRGLEIVADYELSSKYLPTVEVGYYSWMSDNEIMEYNSNGSFIRLGCDYNFLNFISKEDRDIYFLGARYGLSVFNQEVPRLNLTNYWGEQSITFGKETLNAHWLEITVGAKVEIFKNIFLGWTGRVKKQISTSNTEVQPYFIPGYGKTKKNMAADINFYISYALPIKK